MKTKIRSKISFQRLLAATGLAALIIASAMNPLLAQELIQGYGRGDEALQRGMIVRLSQDDPQKVEALKASEIESMHGVVVDRNDAPATLSTDTEKTFVAVTGKYAVLVSDQNGDIESGDYLSISSANGIAMKADNNAALVVGKALGPFTKESNSLSTASVEGEEVRLGRVMTDINIAANPLYRPDKELIPPVIRDFAETISSKPVSSFKLYISLAIILTSAVVAIGILYSGIKGGLVAIGRNPLSKRTITKNIIRVGVFGISTFALGVFAVYLLLKL